MENKILKMIQDIESYEELNLSTLISERLNKSLRLYVNEINQSYNSILDNDHNKIIKELSKK